MPADRPPPGIEARLRFLQSPSAHGVHAGAVAKVEMIETHMSWVFLVGDHVLKMKKPVRYPFLDYSTLAAREFHCREELRLNARLAPDVYLGLLTLQWRHGELTLAPEDWQPPGGQTLDWLVRMRRLPAERMLDNRIAAGTVKPKEVDALGQRLAAFYRAAPPCSITAHDYLGRIQRQQALNREVLQQPQFRLRGVAAALDAADAALERHAALLKARAAAGRIVEGHGDLRPEHVALLATPVVIDCLEFNVALRQLDPIDELAFLGLECAFAGASWIGPQLIAGCAAVLDDAPSPTLVQLYTAGRALMRARLAAAHLLEAEPRLPERWLPRAQRYLDHAVNALAALAGDRRRHDRVSASTTHGCL